MNIKDWCNFNSALAVALCVFLTGTATAGVTNSVFGFRDTFETYGAGNTVNKTNGWIAATNDYATVVSDNTVNNYSKTSLPIPGSSHQKVLKLDPVYDGPLSNRFEQASVTNVYIDMMVRMNPSEPGVESSITNDTTVQVAVFLNTNGQLVVFHSQDPTGWKNRLTTLDYPTIQTGEWTRLTIAMDYLSNDDYLGDKYFQLNVDGMVVSNAYAYEDPGAGTGVGGAGTTNGTWFPCANMGAVDQYLSSLSLDGGALVDDLVVTNGAVTHAEGQVTIFASVGSSGGTIAPAGAVEVQAGTTNGFLITASNWWVVSAIVTNGADIGVPDGVTQTNYQWANAHNGDTIVAYFDLERVNGVSKKWINDQNSTWTNDYYGATTNDHDKDGFSTKEEYFFSTDANNSNSLPSIVDIGKMGNQWYVKWVCTDVDSTLPPFNVEMSTNLLDNPVWQAAMPSNSGARVEGTNVWYQDTNATYNAAAYRLGVSTNTP